MSHLITYHHVPGHPVHFHHIPLRPTIVLALVVLMANVTLVWLALSLRADPADDAAQIQDVIRQQIAALNDRDADALALTYCREQGAIAGDIVAALGPPSSDATLRVARIADIQIIGSRLATAQVVLEVDGPGVIGLDPAPGSLTLFRKGESGWKMCDPGDRGAATLHL